ncbi:MAG: DEAD/DEAH box helicase [Kiritimatiellaeota bacterium]|nr:DEAD/DEAH box helicase [Kiritimatiellota bacterium]
MSFESFRLQARLNSNVRGLGYHTPTPIQTQAIPPIQQGRDVMGLAQTGTGKTAAFALPILDRLMTGGRTGHVRALVIAPTRELAEQIHGDFADLGRETGLGGVTLYGGVGIEQQIKRLRAGADVVIACPGRLLDHIGRGTVQLAGVEVFVLDEADQMLDMGFLPGIREIIGCLPAKRQNLLFSATMPREMRRLAAEVLRDAVTVQVGDCEPVGTVSHCLYPVTQHLKTKLLMALLDQVETESVLVFTRTKHRARRVGEQLQKAGYKATSLQGNLSQNRRRAAMDGFRDGRHRILVATDIAARGIDVNRISHVINYDVPDTVTAYTHRIGRTGRAAKSGDALTLATQDDRAMIQSIERMLGGPIPRRNLEEFDYGECAPQRAPGPGLGRERGSRRGSGSGTSRSQERFHRTRGVPPGTSTRKHSRPGGASRASGPAGPGSGGVYTPVKERPITLSSHTGHAVGSKSGARFGNSGGRRGGRAVFPSRQRG